MKIGIDASRYSHEQATGVEWYSWHIINALVELAKEDELILYSRERLELVDKNLKNKVLPAKRFWTMKALSREMCANPPDVLFVPSHTLPPSLPKRSVLTIHDVAFKYVPKAYSFLQYHYLDWSTKFAVKNASQIITPSEATKNDLMNFYNCPTEKISVVHHGFSEPKNVDDKIFEESEVLKYFQLQPESKYLLFVGRLESKKNLIRLIEAFAKVLKDYPDYKLILAGKRGHGFKKILKTVNSLEIMDKIIMPGYITEEEKIALEKYATGILLPSLYEGFGLTILEAFYHGKPILCSNISSLPEVGGEAVIYCDPYDASSIEKGLRAILEGGSYIENLVKLGKERLKNFSWEKTARETLKILKG